MVNKIQNIIDSIQPHKYQLLYEYPKSNKQVIIGYGLSRPNELYLHVATNNTKIKYLTIFFKKQI